ncbi:alpha/beta-hydrolase [Phlyctema vagabunda]|uniref:Alpha/beta-hydrolase n=1 Tax=Phlyctema vagabunda TaxID=108571 RepID=A0ABR4PW64_9HELO
MPSAIRPVDTHSMDADILSIKKNTYRGIFKKITNWSAEREEEKHNDYSVSTITSKYSTSYFGPMTNYDQPINPKRRRPQSFNWTLSALEVQRLPPASSTAPKSPLPELPSKRRKTTNSRRKRTTIGKTSLRSKIQWDCEIQRQTQLFEFAQEVDPPQYDCAFISQERRIHNFVNGSKPAIVIVPGSFAGISMYESLILSLETQGYAVRFANLPSIISKSLPVSSRPHPATLEDDSNAITRIITELAEEGREILLVGHSYGGIPMTESCSNQTKYERKARGRSGGVIGMLFITSFVPSVGESMKDMMAAIEKPEERFNVELDGRTYLSLNPAHTAPIAFGELPKEQALMQIKKMGIQSLYSFGGSISCEVWRSVPVSYVYCKNDKVNPIEFQQSMVEKVENETGKEVKIYECDGGHYPNVTDPKRIVEIIRKAAGEKLPGK